MILSALLASLVLALPARAQEIDGQAVFIGQGCQACHSVSAAGLAKLGDDTITAPDLSGLAQRHRPGWVERWLTQKNEQHDNSHLKLFTGTDEEMAALVAWLIAQ